MAGNLGDVPDPEALADSDTSLTAPNHDPLAVENRRQSFGAVAEDYDRYRPGYPQSFLERLLAAAGIGAGSTVLDIGAGTGQLTRELLELGYRVIAVEPDDRMRAVLQQRHPSARAVAGSAEEIPLAAGTVDAAVGGQMWHWVDPSRAVPELGRVIRPGGRLNVLWSLRDDRVPWIGRLGDNVVLPDPYRLFDDAVVPEFGEPFGPLERSECEFTHDLTPSEFLAGLGTVSTITLAPDRDEQLARAAGLLEADPDLTGRDLVRVPYVCKAFAATRR